MKHRANRLQPIGKIKPINEALDSDELTSMGLDAKSLAELAKITGIKNAIWGQNQTKFFPVLVMTSDGSEWFKSKPDEPYTMERLINFVNGSEKKYVSREIVGLFFTLEDATKVYDAIPIREEE